MKKLILISLMALSVTGCHPEYVFVPVPPPPELVVDCGVPDAITELQMVDLSWQDRERVFTDKMIDLYTAIGNCSIRMKKIRDYYKTIEVKHDLPISTGNTGRQ